MGFEYRTAVREDVGLLVGLAGGTGSGKSFSAMRLAAGICGNRPFAVLDTEARRATHYADRFRFDHGDLKPPFTPLRYLEAIKAADEAKYPVIVVDSASHEHAGEGGLLDMHDAELDRMAGNDYSKREACKMAAWIKPKGQHKDMVNGLLQVRAHIIMCFRAEEKVEMRRDEKGKMQIVPKRSRIGKDGWIPICEKGLPFEMTCSFLLLSEQPGFPQPIKLEEQHRHLFPADKPIDEASGRALAAWAAGGKAAPVASLSAPSNEGEKSNVPPESAYDKAVKARAELLARVEIAAKGGVTSLREFWERDLTRVERDSLQSEKDRLKRDAEEADRAAATI